ncbi:MAG: hypothetical protein J2P41_19325, partial [Blastocatellia bacterium]|nr:hypothetical protein [Blastocatellia bacterium]
KEVEELFDTEPLVTPELLDLTKWIADYYYAPWGEVIKSCLPAGINAEAETMISITDEGRAALTGASPGRLQSTKMQALAAVAEEGMIALSTLGRLFEKARAAAVVRGLEHSGYVTLKRQMLSAQVKPKRQQAVRLIERAPIEGGKPLNEQQEKVVRILFDSPDPVAFAQLTESANVSASVIRTLEKRGFVEVFMRDVRRDPLGH